MQHLRSKISSLPREPGVYFMKDSQAKVIYVGKAKDLKSRVSSYFIENKDHSAKTRKLVREIRDFEIMLVRNEVEALLLERTLIKHHQPHFNILLRDDKEYPYIRVHFGDDWPQLEIVRRRKDDGAEYFGPFSAAGGLRQGLDAVNKVFPLIRCSAWEFKNAKRVCSYFHMKMCLGPCVNPVSRENYHAMIRDAIELILGNNIDVMIKLENRMTNAAFHEQYELAGQYRDQMRSLETLKEKQSVMLDPTIFADIIGWRRADDLVAAHVLMVRAGKVLGGQSFVIKDQGSSLDDDKSSHEDMSQFMLQYYDGRDVPKLILTEIAIPWAEDLGVAIAQEGQQKVKIQTLVECPEPQWSDLIDIVRKNTAYQLEEAQRLHDRAKTSLQALQATLNLSELPRRIECIDISNLLGTAIVASDVCFIDGNPEKSLYRSYNIKTLQDSPDDFAAIYEVVERRIVRGIKDGDLPNLLVIDGGRGQLDAGLKALANFPGVNLAIVSLAKSRVQKMSTKKLAKKMDSSHPQHSFERVFTPTSETAIPLRPGSPAFRLLTRLRDEAHRFAITKHRKKRTKISMASPLDSVAGVGPKIRAKLLITFGSVEGISRASLEELKKVPGVSEETAVRIFAQSQDSV